MKPFALPVVALMTLLATGCGPTAADFEESDQSAEIRASESVSTEETCQQLLENGQGEGAGLVEDVADYANAIVESDVFDQDMLDQGRQLEADLEPIVTAAGPELRGHLEDVIAAPREVVDQAESGADRLDVEFSDFSQSGTEIVEICFSNEVTTPSASPSAESTPEPSPTVKATPTKNPNAPLIGADTAVANNCAPFDGDPMLYNANYAESHPATFGESWKKVAAGELCITDWDWEPEFLWDDPDATDADDLTLEARAAFSPIISGENEDSIGPSRVASVASLCAENDHQLADASAQKHMIYDRLTAAKLCPSHPQAGQWKGLSQNLPAAEATADAQKKQWERNEENMKNGGYASDGKKYLVGKDLQSGLYQTVGLQVENCYWEMTDATGEIIDNNFISVAPQFELYIPATAAGFTIDGCSMTRIGD